MTMEELIPKIIEHANEYAVESEEQIFVGMEPVRKHKKKRIQKKFIRRYGMKPVYETKKCKKVDVTYDLIIEVCQKFGYPLPDEMLTESNE